MVDDARDGDSSSTDDPAARSAGGVDGPATASGPAAADEDPGRAAVAPDGPRHGVAVRRRDPVRATARGAGQVLITAGVVVLLFVVYELWITNLFGEQKQAAATHALDKQWAQEAAGDSPVVTAGGGTVIVKGKGEVAPPPDRERHYNTTEGAGFAKMYIPSFGADFVLTIIEGTSQADLYAGPGHYIGTQYPGEPGNFALAGHRVNKGAPFDDLGLLHSCDAIVIETQANWYVYRVLPMQNEIATWNSTTHAHCDGVGVQTGQYADVYGRDIVLPTDIAEIFPVPHVDSTAVPQGAEPLITLTTCNPKFSDRQRMIIHGILVKSYPKAAGFLPPQLQETT